ncbi:rod shape-determining protein MreD [Motilibacter rhizosphaerae]|uniref:Rod shape-determining protein MreD n=1 Tax=Motilibacter rhizosphaerae TaxID=598652 RepID=A0A4Q7NRT0_9ACTN|nr:rod shape-determining protein MreD [Motilibacter rhizosphaerae]RZS89787.1 rod shape-determining protein MreD [Motilibacter rhizosphaerae]
MSTLRAALLALLVLTAVLVQSVVLAPLHLPGATPDVVLLVVVGTAQAWGRLPGAVAGFAAGLAVDLLPPSDGAAGRWAAVLTVLGYAVGRTFEHVAAAPLRTLLAVVVAAPASVAGSALLGTLIGDPGVAWSRVPQVALAALAYDLVLTPLVVPAVQRLARTADPEAGVRL